MAQFYPKGTVAQEFGPILKSAVIDNSVVTSIGDAVKLIDQSNAALVTTGDLMAGIVVAHETSKQVGLLVTGAAGAAIGSYAGTFTAASDNETVAKTVVIMDISKMTLYTNTPDATIGTTTGSDSFGYHTDLVDEDQIDESSAALTTAQMTIWGLDPENSANGLYSIYESQLFGV